MDRLLLTRRQILKAAGTAGLLSAAGLSFGPLRAFADDHDVSLGNFGAWGPPEQILELASGDDDFHPAISNDELSLYFTSTRHWNGDTVPAPQPRNHIWLATRPHRQASWGDPAPLPVVNFPNVGSGNASLSPDQLTLYFNSGIPKANGFTGHGFNDLWLVRREDAEDNAGWDPLTLTNLGGGVNTSHSETAPSYFVDPTTAVEHLYFTRFLGNGPGSNGNPNEDWDIYDSVRDASGMFKASAVPVQNLSMPQAQDLLIVRDTRMSVRRDALEIIITSNRPRFDGDVKIERLWVSARRETSSDWPVPILANDGAADGSDEINSGMGDGGPALTRDGKRLFFFSQRIGAGAPGRRHLWTSRRKRQEGDARPDVRSRRQATEK